MSRCITAVCLAAFLASSLAAQPAAKHMLFKVRGASGATVYLLGSVHLLTPDAATLPPQVDSAFVRAKAVAFETSLDSLKLRGPEIFALARLPVGTTLRDVVSPATLAALEKRLPEYGLTVDQVAPFKPWFVGIIAQQLVLQKANFKADYGVDMQLADRARAAGKPTIALESVDFQLKLFDSVSPADQDRALRKLSSPDSTSHELLAIKDAWVRGNTMQLDSLFNHDMRDMTASMDIMLYNRNRNWLPKIEAMLHGKDDVLVVVGAAHLVGSKGLLQLLRAKGYTVEQL